MDYQKINDDIINRAKCRKHDKKNQLEKFLVVGWKKGWKN